MRGLLIALIFCYSPCEATRVIATSPQTTELLFHLGLGRSVVGAVDGSQYPSEAAALPSIGPLFTPSVERAIALRPDLVIVDLHTLNPVFEASLVDLGVETFHWDTLSPESVIEDGYRLLKKIPQGSAKRLRWAETCLGKLRANTTTRKYLVLVWTDPPILIGPRSFFTRLLGKLGFENLMPDKMRSPYITVSTEWLVQQQPDTVFYLRHSAETEAHTSKMLSTWWPGRKVESIPLDVEKFARASLTAIENLESLPLGVPFPAECRVTSR